MSSSVEPAPSPSIWSTIREAVRGSHQDYTQAPIGRAVATGGSFARILLGGSGTVLLIFLINAVFRGAGDAARSGRLTTRHSSAG